MSNYRLSFDVEVKSSQDNGGRIEIFIISRRDVQAWKSNGSNIQDIGLHYTSSGERVNDIFKPSVSDAYAFILSNRSSVDTNTQPKTVEATIIHTWEQEIKESQLKNRV
jgi:hypothetical protein